MKKKFLALFLSAATCLTTAGCSISIPGMGDNISDASDVIEKYVACMDGSCNYHTDMDMEIGIMADAQGMKLDLPIKFSLSADVLDENLHGDMEMSMSFMGQDIEQSAEVYLESGKRKSTTYIYDSEQGYWTVSEDTKNTEAALSFGNLDADDFEDAKMEYDKDKKTYTITQEFGDFADSSSVYDMIDEMYGSMSSMTSMDSDDILDAWEDAKVIYVFDKDFYLTSVAVEDCEYSGTISEDGTDVDMSVALDFEFKFSDYGKIEDSDVEVPKKVKNSAVPSVTINAETEDGGLDENGNLLTDPNKGFVGYDSDEAFSYSDEQHKPEIGVTTPEEMHKQTDQELRTEIETTDPGLTTQYMPIITELGTYNGIPLTAYGDDWNTIFGADGWNFANDDGEYTFMSAENSKYKNAVFYVYNYSRDYTTRADILNNGSYGYSIDCKYSSTYPDMTWNGITFGATAGDIFAAYGNPDNSYDGSLYTMYEYDISDDIEIEFYVYPDDGLQRVEVSNFCGI